jgi:predicted transcriptional regulator
MDFELTSNIAILGWVVTAIVTFFIGQSGIVTKAFDLKFLRIETKMKKESDMIDKALAENDELKDKVKTLTEVVTQLEHQNKELERKVRLIVEYLKTIKVDDPFIEKIIT